jgi:hypothetical protein
MKGHWEWNSRYWEQFALLKLDKSLKTTSGERFDLLSQSLSHARFAVKIERHPFTLTTLGRVLIEQMKQSPDKSEDSFSEAFKCLEEAIRAEGMSNRITIHPYTTLSNGAVYYLRHGGRLTPQQLESIRKHSEIAASMFHYDRQFLDLVSTLSSLL